MRRILLVLGFMLPAFTAVAQAVPHSVAFSARLADNGVALTGAHSLVFKLYTQETSGQPVWTETWSNVPVTEGLVTVELGSVTPMDGMVLTGVRLFLETTVDGTVLSPRMPVVSVPYSIRAEEADTIGTLRAEDLVTGVTAGAGLSSGGTGGIIPLSADFSTVQRRVNGACNAGETLRSVNADGSVNCASETGDISGITTAPGSGLTGGTNSGAANMSVMTCAPGELLKFGAGGWACSPFPTDVTAGPGLMMSAGQLSVSFAPAGGSNGTDSTVARTDHLHDARYPTRGELDGSLVGSMVNRPGNPISWNVLVDVPPAIASGMGGATYTSGTGLTLTGTVFSLTAPVAISLGGTGSTTQNFVDLTTAQTNIAGDKSFNNRIAVGSAAAPKSNLEVTAPQPDLRINWTVNTNFGRLIFSENGGIESGAVQVLGSNFVTPARRNAMEIFNSFGPMVLYTGTTEHFRISLGGNVGVNASAPDTSLTVGGAVNQNSTRIGDMLCGQQFGGIAFGAPNACTNYAMLGDNTNLFLNRVAAGTMFFRSANLNQMILDPNGRLGIGANNPVARLTVAEPNATTVFNPNTVAPVTVSVGHVQSPSGWDAMGVCARGMAGAAMCNAVSGGNYYWGYLTAANQMDTKMDLNGTTGVLTIAGTLVQNSSGTLKKDITFLDEDGFQKALQLIRDTPIATYRYKTMQPDSRLVYGVIAEDTPRELLGEGDRSVNLSTSIGVLMAAVKAQQAEIEKLQARVVELESRR